MTASPLHLGVRGSNLYTTMLPLAWIWIAALPVSCGREGEGPRPASAPAAESTRPAAQGAEQVSAERRAKPGLVESTRAAEPAVEKGWCDVLAADPDPAVVTDADGRARMTATKLPWKVRDRKTGIVMLLCPPGEFTMGSPAGEADRDDDEAQRQVSITTAFYISETEVTQEQWRRTMGANPSLSPGASNPVDQVSWADCQGFCLKTGLRLPSEAEFEYASRAGTTDAYADNYESLGWWEARTWSNTHRVRLNRANRWGLYDMHGNAWEWCADAYSHQAAGTQTAATAGSGSRVLRGGGWFHFGSGGDSRSADRVDSVPGLPDSLIGFRVARTAS